MRVEIEEVRKHEYDEALPLVSLNHISLLCRSVWDSVRFYEDVLGFFLIKRPSSFNFNGAWLYNYGIGIHLIENPESDPLTQPRPINPKDNHISFECSDVKIVKRRLQELGIRYVTSVVEEEGKKADQVFFHDPDGYMIEICNCENIPIIPLKPRMGIFMETVMMETDPFFYSFNQLAILGGLTLMILFYVRLALP